MKRIHLILAISLAILVACKSKQQKPYIDPCIEINEMIRLDQYERQQKDVSPMTYLVDSLAKGDTSKYKQYFYQADEIYSRPDYVFHYTDAAKEKLRLIERNDSLRAKKILAYFRDSTSVRAGKLDCLKGTKNILVHAPDRMYSEIQKVTLKKNYVFDSISIGYIRLRIKYSESRP
jgi:uncharacterized protein YcfL